MNSIQILDLWGVVRKIESVNDGGLDVISGPDFAAIRINRISPNKNLHSGDNYLLAVNISQFGCEDRWQCLQLLVSLYDDNFDVSEQAQDFSLRQNQTFDEALGFASDIYENRP